MPDHIHILLSCSRTIAISKLLEVIKANSSRWIKSLGLEYREFSWQRGYGVFSIDYNSLDALIKYISNQKEHHKKRGFKEEYLLLLERYGVKYDEKYLWD